jgi:outer membrane cobalamin receptor
VACRGQVNGDDNEQFGRHFTGGLAFGYQCLHPESRRAMAPHSAPTFNELYYPYWQCRRSNRRSRRAGGEGQSSLLHWRVSLADLK